MIGLLPENLSNMKTLYSVISCDSSIGTADIAVRDIIGNVHKLTVPMEGLLNHDLGIGFIQDNFPDLTPDERELLMTGIPSHMWNDIFNE